MAMIRKTFTTSIENIVIFADGVRASIAVRDTDDLGNITACMAIVVKGGKVVQPPTNEDVDVKVAAACDTLMKIFTELCDRVTTEKPIFIRGSVPPARPQDVQAR